MRGRGICVKGILVSGKWGMLSPVAYISLCHRRQRPPLTTNHSPSPRHSSRQHHHPAATPSPRPIPPGGHRLATRGSSCLRQAWQKKILDRTIKSQNKDADTRDWATINKGTSQAHLLRPDQPGFTDGWEGKSSLEVGDEALP